MPKGPKGHKRPADVIGNAVRVMEIATGQRGEVYEAEQSKNQAAAELWAQGGKVRAEQMSAKQRTDIARPSTARVIHPEALCGEIVQ